MTIQFNPHKIKPCLLNAGRSLVCLGWLVVPLYVPADTPAVDTSTRSSVIPVSSDSTHSDNTNMDTIPYLIVHGDVDPRIHVELLSWFRSTDMQVEGCTQRHFTTGQQRAVLTVRGESGLTGQFTANIPLQITGVDRCGWEYAATALRMMRAMEDRNASYTELTWLASRQQVFQIEWGSDGGSISTNKFPRPTITTQANYFLGDRIDLQCQTVYYDITDRTKFSCLPQTDLDWYGGVDTIGTMEVYLTAQVDESQHPFLPYVPPPPKTWWQKVNESWPVQLLGNIFANKASG